MNRITNEKFISLRLRCALGDTGVSQRELARLTGITEVTLSRYVNGNRIPKATTLKKIADALGVGLDYFFTEEELKNSNEELNNSTDLVSRQSAIDAHCELCEDKGLCGDICPDVEVFRLIPSAQPEITDEQAIEHLQSTNSLQMTAVLMTALFLARIRLADRRRLMRYGKHCMSTKIRQKNNSKNQKI